MLFANRISRVVLAGLSIGCLGTVASAQFAARDLRVLQDPLATSTGGGQGTLHMPTLDREGLLVGIFMDDKDGSKYMLEAMLTVWIPGWIDPEQSVSLGGLYGKLGEYVVPGDVQDAEPAFAGRVEGTWRMEQHLTGIYEAYVYGRGKGGVETVVGRIHGRFEVRDMEAGVPAPQSPAFRAAGFGKGYDTPTRTKPVVNDAASNSAAKQPSLADARSEGASAGPDLVEARRKLRDGSVLAEARRKLSGSELTDARRKLSGSELADALTGSKAAAGGRGDLGQAGSDPVIKKARILNDAESAAMRRLARKLGDAASGSSSGPGPVKNAFSSAASGAFGTPTNRFATPTRGEQVVWPVLAGEFRGRYELFD